MSADPLPVPIPHLAWPVAFNGVTFATVEQDTTAEILQCVLAILSTPQGECLDDPTFGIPDVLFSQQPLPVEQIRQELERQEPRTRYLVAIAPDAVDSAIARVAVQMQAAAA